MEPDSERATSFFAKALEPAIGRDWSARAGKLEWTVEFTVDHIIGALSKYTLYLSSRSHEHIAVRTTSWPEASQRERLDAIRSFGRALANIAMATPSDVRAFHASGLFDANGYAALGCLETLVHGYDIATGLGLDFEPPTEIIAPVAARLVPWIEPTWDAVVRYTRLENDDDSWTILTTPLEEWEGTARTSRSTKSR